MNLWVRLFLTFLICLSLTLSMLGVFFALTFRDYYETELFNRMLFQADVLEPRLKSFILSGNPFGVNDFLKEESNKFPLLGLSLLDSNGKVISSTWGQKGDDWSAFPEVASVLKRENGFNIRTFEFEKQAFVATPIVSDQEIIGIIVMRSSMEPVSAGTSQVIRFIIGTFLIALLAGVLMVYSSVRIQTQPLQSLIESARNISLGNLDETFESRSSDEVGQLGRVLQIMVTRLKSALREAGEERSRFQAIFSNMVDGLLLIDSNGKILLANNSFLTIFGVSFKDIIGLQIDNSVLPLQLSAIILRGEDGVDSEMMLEKPTKRALRIRTATIEQDGYAIGTLSICEDTTRMKLLESSEQEFVQYISHELKTPLASLSASIETITTKAKHDPEAQAKFLSNMGEDVHRLTDLVNSILTYQRIRDTGEQMFKFGAVEMVLDVHGRFLAYANKRKIHFDFEVPDDEVYVIANKDRIIQVLINFIDNAIRFTPEGGKVIVGIEDTPDSRRVKFYVSDTGIGIPKEYIGRIGERFIKIPRKDHRFDTQVGLGVSICKEILRRHGSPLEVVSEEGKGTTFSFYLKRATQSNSREKSADLTE